MWGEFTCVILIAVSLAGADLPSFDIASIRPGSSAMMSKVDRVDPSRFRAVNANLAELIEWAWQIPQDRIAGPDRIRSNDSTFDIDAAMPAATTDASARLMLRRLLAERFSLAVHVATREQSGYALVVDKGGANLRISALQTAAGIRVSGDAADAKLRAPAATMSQFARILSLTIETPVENRTGLDGVFEINMEFSKLGPNESDAPTVFDALKAVGLRLEKAQIPVETIVIDHANFKPSEN